MVGVFGVGIGRVFQSQRFWAEYWKFMGLFSDSPEWIMDCLWAVRR